jgi:hypothetical protein
MTIKTLASSTVALAVRDAWSKAAGFPYLAREQWARDRGVGATLYQQEPIGAQLDVTDDLELLATDALAKGRINASEKAQLSAAAALAAAVGQALQDERAKT